MCSSDLEAGRRKRGEVVQAITDQLKTNGMMTLADLCEALGRDKNLVHPVLARMQKPTTKPAMPKRVYIAEYVYDQEGMKPYPRPLYALGRCQDAVKPERDTKAVQKRYRARRLSRATTNSVFNLAGAMKRGTFQINF